MLVAGLIARHFILFWVLTGPAAMSRTIAPVVTALTDLAMGASLVSIFAVSAPALHQGADVGADPRRQGPRRGFPKTTREPRSDRR